MIEKLINTNRKFFNDILNGYAIIGFSILAFIILLIGNILRVFL
jgi:hypothetical protein